MLHVKASIILCLVILLTGVGWGEDRARINLWDGPPPGFLKDGPAETQEDRGTIRNVTVPSVTIFPADPQKRTGQALILCAGGGYGGLDWKTHVEYAADVFNPLGVTIIGLRYRLRPPHKLDNAGIQALTLLDAQRAVRMMRHRSADWHIDPRQIGIAGYSAGGNLAMNLAANFDAGDPQADDPVDRQSCRPDFAVGLATWHWRQKASPFVFRADSPPVLLVHATNDGLEGGAPIELPRQIATDLQKLGVPVRLAVFDEGAHGVGNLIPQRVKQGFPPARWPHLLLDWLRAQRQVEQAHAEIWRRFVDPHGILLDFTDLNGAINYPTPEECRQGMPNALGWWSPIENGAMFNGLYMDAAVLRWQARRSEADAAKARRLMEGLLKLNSLNDIPGFVGRGVSTDGHSHYSMGSNDQTLPWLVGLWRYWQSGLATPEEKTRIERHLTQTIAAIVEAGWNMPAEPPFKKRGSFNGFHFEEAARMLFTMKLMHVLTGDAKWDGLYQTELQKRGGPKDLSKREICQQGMAFFYAKTHNWTSCTAVSALRGLWDMETDPTVKSAYADGLRASAQLAAESLPLAQQYDPHNKAVFLLDWRQSMLPLWKPQHTEQEAVALAEAQLRAFHKTSPRRQLETAFIREPTAAAWIVTLCPDPVVVQAHAAQIDQVIGRYDYSTLYYSTFFWVEGAWQRLHGPTIR